MACYRTGQFLSKVFTVATASDKAGQEEEEEEKKAPKHGGK